jgi:hypothetical protein
MANSITFGAGITVGQGIVAGVGTPAPSGGNLGSITVASTGYPAAPNPPEGTTNGANATEAIFYFPLFGTVTGGTSMLVHFAAASFFGPVDQGWLMLIDGSYSGFTVSGGAINGVTSGAGLSQSFTIGGVTAILSGNNGSGVFSGRYYFDGDPFGLDTKLGQTLSISINLV